MRTSSLCPVCGHEIDPALIVPNEATREAVNALETICDNVSKGCSWEGTPLGPRVDLRASHRACDLGIEWGDAASPQ